MNRPIATIENGFIPPYRSTTTSYGKVISMAATLRSLDLNKSFVIDQHRVKFAHNTAKRLGIRIRTYKTVEGKLRITRIE